MHKQATGIASLSPEGKVEALENRIITEKSLPKKKLSPRLLKSTVTNAKMKEEFSCLTMTSSKALKDKYTKLKQKNKKTRKK